MLVCTICQGTGWRVLHRQGDSVYTPEEYQECLKHGVYLVPCFYIATTYVSCECRFFKSIQFTDWTNTTSTFRVLDCAATNNHIIGWDTPDLNRAALSGPVYQTGGFNQAPSCPSVIW